MIDRVAISPRWNLQSLLRQPVDVAAGAILIFGMLFINEANFRSSLAMDSGADWQALLKLAISGACGAYGLWFTDFARLRHLGLAATGMALFSLWAYLCALKSINVVYSLTCCTTLLSTLVFADAVTQRLGKRRTVLICFSVLVLFLIGCWCANVVAPGLNSFDPLVDATSDLNRFAGLLHPNGTAGLAATSIGLGFVAANAGYISWSRFASIFVFAAITLFLTGSRTWLFATVLVSAYGVMRYFDMLSRSVILCTGVVAISLAIFYLSSSWNSSKVDNALASITRSGTSDEIYTLTGRADLWAFCIKKIRTSPIFGYGYGCQRFVIADEHFWPTRHAHNVLLNATLGTGLIGGAILAGVILFQFYRMLVDRCDFPDTILLLVLAGGVSENPLFNPIPGALTFLFLASLSWRDSNRFVE